MVKIGPTENVDWHKTSSWDTSPTGHAKSDQKPIRLNWMFNICHGRQPLTFDVEALSYR